MFEFIIGVTVGVVLVWLLGATITFFKEVKQSRERRTRARIQADLVRQGWHLPNSSWN